MTADAVSWYEEHPMMSLDLLNAVGAVPDTAIIDIGGGASTLVDHLVARGHRDLTVLDVSTVALAWARRWLADPDQIVWIKHDLLTGTPARRWDIWHDRAVLHFLHDDRDRHTYVEQLHRALEPAAAFVIGTFAEDGPTHCSGLEVRRHRPEELAELLGDVEIVQARRHVHHTPSGAEQPFNFVAGRLRPYEAGAP